MSETPTPDLSERAREEAERRWPSQAAMFGIEHSTSGRAFVAGAAWAAEQSAAHDEQMRRDAKAEALREAADAIDAESEATGGMYAGDCTERLRERADSLGTPVADAPAAPEEGRARTAMVVNITPPSPTLVPVPMGRCPRCGYGGAR